MTHKRSARATRHCGAAWFSPSANRRWKPAAIPSGIAHRRAAPPHNAWASIVGSSNAASPTVSSAALRMRTSPQTGPGVGRSDF
ncbi:hypothetical protein [uncultured Actinomyces sp.]|uniref:hypothetical protein n=1 Tax=uncultured Actinomyces sp. TaxID=249061 RepID=UPI00261A1B1F|nr:hypothetical protein [uncultured Actinomyces sp.]